MTKHTILVLFVALVGTCAAQDPITPPYDIRINPNCTASKPEGGLVALDCNDLRYDVEIREATGSGEWFRMWTARAPEYPAPGDTVVYDHQGTGLLDSTFYEIRARTWHPEKFFSRPDGGKWRVFGHSAWTKSDPYLVVLTEAPADTVNLVLDGIQVIIIRNKS